MEPPIQTGSLLIRMQNCQQQLPAALAKVGEWALAYPFRTATLKIGELAAAAEVSVASVNRYARFLGYEGFPEFREDLLRAFES
ncbi:MurR/RpiR family transcriptional regulator, partial [Azospirillum melinis]|nr:MurR/RpiR family transcriptional regulator [Azospirillum melinis]